MKPFSTGLKYKRSVSGGGESKDWPGNLEHFLSPQQFPELYQRRVALGGELILPIHCAETQNDHVQPGRSGAHIGLMRSVQKHTQHCVETNDGGKLKSDRIFFEAQSKYGMHHNGDHGDNAMRKKVCLKTILNLFHFCNARALLDFLASVKAAGFETDDLADAFSLALKRAVKMFRERRNVLGWVPGQVIAIAGYDFGTRNFAVCVLEVTALDAPCTETYVTCLNETKTHLVERPHFRVLRWQLLDLLDKTVRADYRGPSEIYVRRDPDNNVTASAYDPNVEVRKAKRKRAASETREDADAPKKKRARKADDPNVEARKAKHKREDADAPKKKERTRKAPIVIDIREDDSM
jgi:hypothetical protein